MNESNSQVNQGSFDKSTLNFTLLDKLNDGNKKADKNKISNFYKNSIPKLKLKTVSYANSKNTDSSQTIALNENLLKKSKAKIKEKNIKEIFNSEEMLIPSITSIPSNSDNKSLSCLDLNLKGNIDKTNINFDHNKNIKNKLLDNTHSKHPKYNLKMKRNIINKNSEIIAQLLSNNIMRILEKNNYICETELEEETNSVFYGEILDISLKQFISKLVILSNIEYSTVVLIGIYLDRFCEINSFNITYSTVYRILCSCLIVAIKYNEDKHYSLQYYSSICGIPTNDLIILESIFLNMIDFELYIKGRLFGKCCKFLLNIDNNSKIIEKPIK